MTQALVETVGMRRQRLKRWLVVANVGVALLLSALVFTVLTSAKRGFEDRALKAAEGRAAVAQLNLASELGVVDAVMRATVQDLAHRATHDGDHDALTLLPNRVLLLERLSERPSQAGRPRWIETDRRRDTTAAARRARLPDSQAAFGAPIPLANGQRVSVGVSMGLASSQGDTDTPAELLARADQAMLEAKRQGKGRLEIHVGLASGAQPQLH